MPSARNPYGRENIPRTVTDHDDRIQVLERMRYACGKWHYIGVGADPPFQNSWVNQGGTLAPMRYRRLFACGIEIQGSITGGAPGTVVFTLPDEPGLRPDYELRLAASDDTGLFMVFRILQNGDVIAGVI